MGRLSAEEKAELERMRDVIVRRMDELDDQVSYGAMSDEQRCATLEDELGQGYFQTLREINSLLHSKAPREQPHVALAGASVIAVLLLALVAGFIYPGSGVSGAVTMEPSLLEEPIFLVDGATENLDFEGPLTISDVIAEYRGPGDFALFINDGRGKHALLSGDKAQARCEGCGATYKPPYLLELKSQGGSLTITEMIV